MGGKTSTSSQQVTIPPEVMARYNAVNARAETAADTPFKQYSTDPSAFVAQLTGPQQAGIQGTMNAAGQAQPYFQAATNQLMGAQGSAQPLMSQAQSLARASARDVNPGELQTQQYMSPYIGNVVEAQRALTERQQQAQMSGQTGQAIRSGAFGGDRSGIVAANLAKEQQLAQAGILSPLLQQGYSQALQTAQQQQGLGLSAEQANRATQGQAAQLLGGLGAQQYGMGAQTSQALAGLGTGAQGAALQGAQAQMGAGQMAQQTEQAGLQALYNQFLQQQSYPFQVAQFLGNIAMGTGALSGSTTTGRQPGGFFSDERLKQNITPIGELFDGQKVVSYQYEGEPEEATRIGLIAQDVERKKPEAVGLAGGFRTVNYKKATEDAASMGGGVKPRHAGETFARGGYADGGSPLLSGLGGGDMAALLQAQQQMYSPYGGAGPYGGATGASMYGGGAYVPQASLPVTELAAPAPLPEQPSALETMNQMAQLGKSAGDIYAGGQKRGWWGKEETSTTTTPGGVAAGSESVAAAEAAARQRAEADAAKESTRSGPRFARGGAAQADLFGRVPAQDGGAMPYSGGSGQGLSIPQQAGDQSLSLNAPSLPQQGASPFDKLVGLAGTAGSVMGGLGAMGFGKAADGKAGGGEVTSGVNPYEKAKGLNIPTDIKTPEMMTGTELNKGRTPFEDVQDIARVAAMFMRDGGRAGYQDGGPPDADKSAIRLSPEMREGFANPQYFSAPGLAVGAIRDVFSRLGKYPYEPGGDYPSVTQTPPPAPRPAGVAAAPPPSPAGGAGVAGGAGRPRTPAAPPEPVRPPQTGLGDLPPIPPGGVGMTPAESSAAIAQRGRPVTAGVSSAGTPVADMAAGRPGRLESLLGAGKEKIRDLGLSKAENLIPLLTGIAAMGVAPTRSLGVALASGVGAGAQAYLPTRQAMEDIRGTQAGTQRTAAEAALLRAQTGGAEAEAWNLLQKGYLDRGLRLVVDPNGPIANPFGRFRVEPLVGQMGGSAEQLSPRAWCGTSRASR